MINIKNTLDIKLFEILYFLSPILSIFHKLINPKKYCLYITLFIDFCYKNFITDKLFEVL